MDQSLIADFRHRLADGYVGYGDHAKEYFILHTLKGVLKHLWFKTGAGDGCGCCTNSGNDQTDVAENSNSCMWNWQMKADLFFILYSTTIYLFCLSWICKKEHQR